jgi:hypothetical protein
MAPELKWTKKVGTIHHARWMAAIIYVLKMMFAGLQFDLSVSQRQGILDLSFFFVYLYPFYWFSVPVPADSPFLTLSLWKDLKRWEVRDKELSKECLKKVNLHTMYLSGCHVILAFWSDKVSDEVKMRMAAVLLDCPRIPTPIGKPDRPQMDEDKELHDFVDSQSWLFFEVTYIYIYITF